jgi:hypothetical protein
MGEVKEIKEAKELKSFHPAHPTPLHSPGRFAGSVWAGALQEARGGCAGAGAGAGALQEARGGAIRAMKQSCRPDGSPRALEA